MFYGHLQSPLFHTASSIITKLIIRNLTSVDLHRSLCIICEEADQMIQSLSTPHLRFCFESALGIKLRDLSCSDGVHYLWATVKAFWMPVEGRFGRYDNSLLISHFFTGFRSRLWSELACQLGWLWGESYICSSCHCKLAVTLLKLCFIGLTELVILLLINNASCIYRYIGGSMDWNVNSQTLRRTGIWNPLGCRHLSGFVFSS